MPILAGLVLMACAAVLAWLALQGGQWRQEKAARVRCPTLLQEAACTLEQDVRTGQFRAVRTCSLLGEGGTCQGACLRQLNLGLQVARA